MPVVIDPPQPGRGQTRTNSALVVKSIWEPQAGPQTAAFNCAADQIGYGGAAGGGKSHFILGMAALKHKRSIVFRKYFPSFRAMIEDSRQIFNAVGEDASTDSYNESLHRWKRPDGQSLEFAAVSLDKELKKYQGQPHDLIAFDEATEMPERHVRFLMGWNRTSLPEQPCQIVFTFNPPMDEEGNWIIGFFAPWLDEHYPDRAGDGEIRYVARIADGHGIDRDVFFKDLEDVPEEYRDMVKTRTFFHASLADNPIYMATGYASTIEAMPEPLRSLLKGQFNAARSDNPWQVIPTAWVRLAQERWKERLSPDLPLTTIGVDVARGGEDKTVIAKRYGNWFAPLIKYPGKVTPDGPAVAGLVLKEVDYSQPAVNVDVIGVGSSVYDHLKHNPALQTNAVNVATKSTATDKSGKLGFINLRAEMLWKLREALDPATGEGLALPPDSELLADLCAPRWTLQSNGIKVESKDDIKKRIGRSPDCGDALALAFAQLETSFDNLDEDVANALLNYRGRI